MDRAFSPQRLAAVHLGLRPRLVWNAPLALKHGLPRAKPQAGMERAVGAKE